jgi:hypothetical protein
MDIPERDNMKKCKAKTKDGKACPARPGANGLCTMHQPGTAKELSSRAVEARRREREAALQEAAKKLRVPKDGTEVNEALLQCFAETKAGLLDPEVARAVSGLANVFFRGLEIAELERRIGAIEERQRAQSHQG